MLLLLHEQDKMAPDWLHQEVNNNNIRLSSEAILSPILVFEHVTISQLTCFDAIFVLGKAPGTS